MSRAFAIFKNSREKHLETVALDKICIDERGMGGGQRVGTMDPIRQGLKACYRSITLHKYVVEESRLPPAYVFWKEGIRHHWVR